MSCPSIEELNLLHSTICKALGDPKRIQILFALSEKPCNVSDLAEALCTPQPTVSRHLAILRQQALVETERDGAFVIYSLSDPALIDILNQMRAVLRRSLDRQQESIA